jgi:hypothetical protein
MSRWQGPAWRGRRRRTGRLTWVAGYYDLEGVARYAKPEWNDGESAVELR